MDPHVYRVLMLGFTLRFWTSSQADRLLGISSAPLLERMRRQHLVEKQSAVYSRPMPLQFPLFWGCPGDKAPPFAEWAYQLSQREQGAPKHGEFWHLTERAASMTGCPVPDLTKPFQLSHDLQVPEMWIATKLIEPELAEGWIGEDFFRLRHAKKLKGLVPDIAVLKPGGSIRRVVEFCGSSYTAERLQDIHEVCQAAAISWEGW